MWRIWVTEYRSLPRWRRRLVVISGVVVAGLAMMILWQADDWLVGWLVLAVWVGAAGAIYGSWWGVRRVWARVRSRPMEGKVMEPRDGWVGWGERWQRWMTERFKLGIFEREAGFIVWWITGVMVLAVVGVVAAAVGGVAGILAIAGILAFWYAVLIIWMVWYGLRLVVRLVWGTGRLVVKNPRVIVEVEIGGN